MAGFLRLPAFHKNDNLSEAASTLPEEVLDNKMVALFIIPPMNSKRNETNIPARLRQEQETASETKWVITCTSRC